MRRVLTGLLVISLAGILGSCSRIERAVEAKNAPAGIPEVPPQFRGGGSASSGVVAKVSVDEPEDVTVENVDRLREREKDLVWTDPDNPEAELDGMAEVIEQGAKRGAWRISFSEARKLAVREGKPVLIWFTDTLRSPLCKALSAEVFSTKEFEDWADEEIVRVRLDFNVAGKGDSLDEQMDSRVRRENYLEELKKRYKVRGLPSVLLLAPDGTVIGRYRGYQRTYGEFYFKRLQYDAEAARKHHGDWKEKMGRRGYREWSDPKGRTVFAKLLRYQGGQLLLVEPDGKRLKARESDLSAGDRDWIRREKERRRK